MAAGMLELGRSPELRQLIGANAQHVAVEYYNPGRIETHNGKMIRRAVASSRIQVGLSVAGVEVNHNTQRIACAASVAPSASWHCDGLVLQPPGSDTAFITVRLQPNFIQVPPGFDDVWSAATASVWEAAASFDSAYVQPGLAEVAFRLFLEWHGQRTQLCVDIGFGMDPDALETVCSASLGDVATSTQSCDSANNTCRIGTSLVVDLAVNPSVIATNDGVVHLHAHVCDYQDRSRVIATTKQ
jgi:hypothetical protein